MSGPKRTDVTGLTHHAGLGQEELRDLIAQEGRDFNTHLFLADRDNMRSHLVNTLEKAKAELEAFDRGTAWVTVMKKFGWETHDVSEHIVYDDTYRDFVGSRAELAKLYPDHSSLQEDE